MSLSLYKQKRNFADTPEPVSATLQQQNKLIFVVQRHNASRLHYDFRLEMDGVLKSWAVPKGPSLNPKDKRLAMMVEDHPIDYAGFEGIIPEGNYGAGIVEIWDSGTYTLSAENKNNGGEAIAAGSLKFILNGRKLKGQFALVKLKKGAPNSWLLIKERDDYATDEPYNSEDETDPASPINKTLAAAGKVQKSAATVKKAPKKAAAAAKKKLPVLHEATALDGLSKKVAFTHVDKLFWPADGLTKGDLIQYYNAMYRYMKPYLQGRPQSMRRTPSGIEEAGFFQKDVGNSAPEWAQTASIFSESNKRNIDYLLCNNKDTLLYMANMGCIEINPWNSTVKHLDKPDYLVLDLDPSEKNSFDDVITVANVIKEVLDRAGAAAYCKTSGATGLHIYIPLGAKYSYDESRPFAEQIAALTVQQLPDINTIKRAINEREDKLYIDFMQNKWGQTVAAPYSVRPKPGATVSMPLEWAAVKPGLQIAEFTIKNALQRVEKAGDLFLPVLGKGINLQVCKKKLEKL